jgi:hypothetical protein
MREVLPMNARRRNDREKPNDSGGRELGFVNHRVAAPFIAFSGCKAVASAFSEMGLKNYSEPLVLTCFLNTGVGIVDGLYLFLRLLP